MRTGAKLGLTLAVLAAAGAGAATWLLGHGYSARETPSALEEWVARRVRHLATPRRARELKNPVPLTSEVLAESRAHWADHCAVCHGNDGRGQTEVGQGLYPKAPDMTRHETQDLSDGEIFYIIENGVRLTGMPAWGEGDAHAAESWGLVHFVRHLPKVTSAELAEMEDMNPVSRHELQEEEEARRFLAGEDAPHGSPGHEH